MRNSWLTQPVDESFKPQIHKEKVSGGAPKQAIEINNLSFSFPDRPGNILNNINLSIGYGEKIGIAGASGSGKSTLIRVLLRLTTTRVRYICSAEISRLSLGMK